MIIKEIEFVLEKLPKKEYPGPDSFSDKFY